MKTKFRPQRKTIKINHENSWSNGRTYLYRIQAANALGRPLEEENVVHHHNDNQFVVCENNQYHLFLHARQKALIKSGNVHKRRCIFCGEWDLETILFKDKASGNCWHRRCRNLHLLVTGHHSYLKQRECTS